MTGNITGTKFTDVTGNSFSGDDTGLGGVNINLYRDLDNSGDLSAGDGLPVATTTTAAGTGAYSFNALLPGTYFVQEVVPAGYTQTGGGIYTVNVTAGSTALGNDFDDFQNISISGTKFNDLTGNGFSGDDTGLGGVTINLYLNGGNTPVASTTTAADGSYSFTDLGPGSYTVQEAVPAGSTQTGGNAGYTISATSGTNSTGNDFDDFQNITISGNKYNDITGNSFSADDTGLGGVTINLSSGSTVIATTTTAADGSYSFTNLGPGTYVVQEAVPAGSTQTGGNAGYTISTSSGSNSTGNNFDDFQNISISGTKFNDITGNSFSADDTGLGGVTINLYSGSTVIATTTTAADGSYSFTNLGPGTYSVQEAVPAGSTQTGGNAGYTISATSGSNSTGNDFDDFQNITISGTKYNDITGNSFSADDTGLSGVTINLLSGSTVIASTTTAADGSYSFTNLGPGSYSVQEVVPAGSTQTGGNAGYTISATSGTNSTGNNFDDFHNISISGTKFKDITGNSFSADDIGLLGVTINLYKNGGVNPVATTTTNVIGDYSFSNLGPGTYTVQEVVPAGWIQTGGNAGYTISATSGSNSTGNNFDDFQNTSISGTKYTDITGNGFSADDTVLAGVTINLYKNGGANPVATTTTDVNGNYSFSNLGSGSYSVQEVVPTGWTQTGGNAGYAIIATSGSNSTRNNFDDFQNICISGTKFKDITGNGFSADDTGLAGVTINLYKNGASTAVATTTTAANGSYSFTNLGPGTYSVQEVVPAGWTQTGGVGGYSVSATSGGNYTGKNFDDFQTINISGTKYTDITGNSFSADDTGLGGVTINLYKNGGANPVATTTTAANGSYSFSNLGAGTYSVQEVVPAGWTQTGGNAGYTIVATSGTNSTGNNFDDFQNICISGTKFKDITGNGFSNDDTGLSGVTINLFKNGGSTAVATTTTAANGSYSFTNLGPGTYSVQEVVPAGWTQTGGVGGYSISATSGGNYTGKNFDDFLNGSITGTKFNDLTGNGFSSDDTGLGGVTIKLFKDMNGDGVLTSADGNAVASTVTAANGTYSFTNVAGGKYFVQEVVPTGYVQTGGGPNGPVGNTYYTVVVPSGQSCTANNFDDYEADCADEIAKLSNIKYLINGTTTVTDLRGNTHQGDLVQVTFTIAAGTPPHQLTLVSYTAPGSTFDANTAAQQQVFDYDTGVFGPGTYTLEVLIPNSYYQIDFVCDGYIDHFGSANSNIFYTNEGRLISADNGGTSAKLSNGASLAGSVFVDGTNNGVHDANDVGIGLVKITLTGTDNSNHAVSLTTYTKSDGTYLFNNLAAGKYTIKETQPAGFTDGSDILGSLGGTLGNDQFSTITVAASANGTKYDFGEKTPGTANCTAGLQADPADASKAAIVINGTTGCDVIVITYSSSKYNVTSNGVLVGSYANNLSGKTVDRLIVNGGAGNDCITIDSSVTSAVVAELYGGDGNDTLTGGANCSNILVGGNGKDMLVGGGQRDLLIGGNGADSINGGGGDDLMIAGSTAFDANPTALRAIFAEWNTTTRDYATRVSNIFGTGSGTRLNGSYFLSLGNVFDDGKVDSIVGGSGQEWFLANNDSANLDSITDLVSGETATDID